MTDRASAERIVIVEAGHPGSGGYTIAIRVPADGVTYQSVPVRIGGFQPEAEVRVLDATCRLLDKFELHQAGAFALNLVDGSESSITPVVNPPDDTFLSPERYETCPGA